MSPLFHITEQTAWETAQTQGSYHAPSLTTEGFIHLSESTQVLWVANQFYRSQPDLVLLEIEPDRLSAELGYDEVPGHGTFPQLYGPLNLDAIVPVWPFTPNETGEFTTW